MTSPAPATFTQWSSLATSIGVDAVGDWVPPDHKERCSAYSKYDQLYWNDPQQYSLRVLEGEAPIYIPSAETIVDTTSHYYLKGLRIGIKEPTKHKDIQKALDDFLKREMFYARFHTSKTSGVARGDFVLHLTANPKKVLGKRISLNSVEPAVVYPVWDSNSRDKMVSCDLVEPFTEEVTGNALGALPKKLIRVLRYTLVEEAETSSAVYREQVIFDTNGTESWWKSTAKPLRTELNRAKLDPQITTIPVYWFKNRDWDGQDYGSSDLRGIESIIQSISQATTDTQAALSLEGLGVYATDGGRPIDDTGAEKDWVIAPGVVLEVPTGSKFTRVQGVTSIAPMADQIEYLEKKMHEGSALTDVAMGTSNVQVAASGIALQIQFQPTLAKIEQRDEMGMAKLEQLFFDWMTWMGIFEKMDFADAEILVEIGEKLPINRTDRVNELNNMMDRKVISAQYYRDQMAILGYEFPTDIQAQIDDDAKRAAEAIKAAQPDPTPDPIGVDNQTVINDKGAVVPAAQAGNQSNNRNRVNESRGTEALNQKASA